MPAVATVRGRDLRRAGAVPGSGPAHPGERGRTPTSLLPIVAASRPGRDRRDSARAARPHSSGGASRKAWCKRPCATWLISPSGSWAGIACQGVNDRFSPKAIRPGVSNTCFGIQIRATVWNGAASSGHSTVGSSIGVVLSSLKSWTWKRKTAPRDPRRPRQAPREGNRGNPPSAVWSRLVRQRPDGGTRPALRTSHRAAPRPAVPPGNSAGTAENFMHVSPNLYGVVLQYRVVSGLAIRLLGELDQPKKGGEPPLEKGKQENGCQRPAPAR